jgi:hypothetical protein
VKKSFNIQELLQCKSKCHETKLMHTSSSRAFQRYQEHDLKHPGLVNLIVTKQNKLPCFTHTFGNMNELLFMYEVHREDAIVDRWMKCDHDTNVLNEISA